MVFIIQENRSFDNLFHRYPYADSADFGYAHDGTRVRLQPVSISAAYDLSNGLDAFVKSYDSGKMDGYDERQVIPPRRAEVPLAAAQYPAYAYVPHSEIAPYWSIAGQYVLADRMFQSNIDQSFAAHLYFVAGQARHTVDVPNGFPWGCDAPGNVSVPTLSDTRERAGRLYPCFDLHTLAHELESRRLPWHYYAPAINVRMAAHGELGYVYYSSNAPLPVRRLRVVDESGKPREQQSQKRLALKPSRTGRIAKKFNIGQLWSAFDAVASVRYGPSWHRNVISPPSRALSDIASGKLGAVTWVVPDWRNSDHPLSRSATGPSWVAAIVNAIGRSEFWNDTVILITWDDSGGWYDHVPPPRVDFDGLGIRVPLLVVSPYAKRGVVAHGQYEFGSLLRLAEAAFDLPPLAASDSRARDLTDCFDFSQAPRRFEPIAAPFSSATFLRQLPSTRPPDND